MTTSIADEGRARRLVEDDVCTLCGGGFVVVNEETTYEPRSRTYACTNHRDHGTGRCPGTIITLYGDGHISRRVYGRGNVPFDRERGE